MIGQLVSRQAASELAADPISGALGFTNRQRSALQLEKAVGIGAVGAVAGVVVAAALSPLFPIGLARTAEPDPGLDIDIDALVIGGLAIFVATTTLRGRWPGSPAARRSRTRRRGAADPGRRLGPRPVDARAPDRRV